MKTKYILVPAAVMALLCSCGKEATVGINYSAKRHFDAWRALNYPAATKVEPGIYIVNEDKGNGEAIGDADNSPYLLVDYTATYTDGTYSVYTSEEIARRMGTYSQTGYYGPRVWYRTGDGILAGLEAEVSRLNVGGSAKILIPGWLCTYTKYDTEDEYLANESGTDAIYELKVRERIPDIKKWEIDSVMNYMAHNYPNVAASDSLREGYYYIQRKAPADDEEAFTSSSTIYINYTGRRLDGTVFDSNVADTAKKYGFYSSSKTYEPTLINFDEDDYTDITMTSSSTSVIDGFAYMISKMGPYEKGTAVMYSLYGYYQSGSGSDIPSYSPLRFDIDIVNEDGSSK